MSSYVISKFEENISKEYLNSIRFIKTEDIKDKILYHILNQKNKENVLFLIQNDMIPKSMSLYLFQFIVNNGYWDMFLELDYNKFNIHANDNYALNMSSKNGHIELIDFLVQKGADIHFDRERVLSISCCHGQLEVVKFLVQKGANICNLKTFCLECVIQNDHVEILKFLIENGAKVRSICINELERLVKNGHIDVVKLLINSDLEFFSTDKNTIEFVKNHYLSEFYEKFKIDSNIIPQTKNDVLKYINSQDLESIKKCNEFDFSSDQYYYFFKALELNNYELLEVIFNFIENKQELKNYVEDVSFILNEDNKNNYRKLFKNIELVKIKTKINELLTELTQFKSEYC